MPRVADLVAYPLKSFDGVAVDRATLGPTGALCGDRSYALVEAGVDPQQASVGGGGGYVNGKSEPAIHRLRASYELAGPADATPTEVTVERPGPEGTTARTFALPDEGNALAEWVGEYLGYQVDLVREPDGGFPDDRAAPGPTVVSVATLEAVASWFDAIDDATEARRRLRPNVVIDECPAFWEDQLFAAQGEGVRVRIGAVDLVGVNPCQRCVVPSRDPDTGEPIDEFRETFINQRRETRPEWTAGDRYDHDFRMMINTVVPTRSWGEAITVGDAVAIDEVITVDETGTERTTPVKGAASAAADERER